MNSFTGRNVDLSQTEHFRDSATLLDRLELAHDVAVRKGDVVVRGWAVRSERLKDALAQKRPLQEDDLIPNIMQKGVDLRIGLDMAKLALQRLVSTIAIVTADSDLIPACKFVRREGLRLVLVLLKGKCQRDLAVHADAVIEDS